MVGGGWWEGSSRMARRLIQCSRLTPAVCKEAYTAILLGPCPVPCPTYTLQHVVTLLFLRKVHAQQHMTSAADVQLMEQWL